MCTVCKFLSSEDILTKTSYKITDSFSMDPYTRIKDESLRNLYWIPFELFFPREMCLRGNGPGGNCNTEIVIWIRIINCTKFITSLITINKLTSYGM
jgi:hypothetical protein